ncbi:probable polygalacturonase At3g15720, partial [Arabidopsis lyrata subsp. lyrata]|uniref:probable polygalacturonase At3g15720 n=1 Tax=Arabidopsis lyrata subsp. lyrata TaxID=81972 RepID=UPI000A29A676
FLYFGFVSGENYNVLDFGAKGDGKTDDSKAFIKAWKTMCGDEGDTKTILVPSSQTFLLQPLQFQGPCGSSPVFQMDGEIVAPSDESLWLNLDQKSKKWISFSNVNDLTVVGSGSINGFGSSFWESLDFNNCNNLKISGITSKDSPRNHISIDSCNIVMISNIQLFAPETSPNTDGIDISTSTNVDISKSTIGTGDDCIALNTGCVNINITEIVCGPGHGISIGSLGANGQVAKVENVQVTHCIFNKTTNGARIKTCQGGEGYVKHIYFEHITIIDAKNPIIIDQHYVDKGHSSFESNKDSEAVAISDVKFIDFHGTTPNENIITLNCSKIKPCKNIVFNDINITTEEGGKPKSDCNYVMGNSEWHYL